MKRIFLATYLLVFLSLAFADNTVAAVNPDDIVVKIKTLKKQGKLDEAKTLAQQSITQFPNDADLYTMLASVYYQEKNYASAESVLVPAIKKFPSNTDLADLMKSVQKALHPSSAASVATAQSGPDYYMSLIKDKMRTGEYADALTIVNEGLEKYPHSDTLLTMKIKIQYQQKDYRSAAESARNAISFTPQNIEATEILDDIVSNYSKEALGPNQLGFTQQSIYSTSPDRYWDYTNIFYTHDVPWGMVLGSLNFASRLSEDALQGALESIVNLTDSFYVDVNVAYANNLSIFPNWTLGAEGYLDIAQLFTISFGDLYRNVDPTYFNTYTASISKETEHYWFMFRPFFFVPESGPQSENSIFYTATIRRFISNEDHFVGVTLGYGVTPDLAELKTVDFITIDDKFIGLNYQFPLSDHRYILMIGATYENQIFPSGTVRQLSGLNFAFRGRF